MSAIVREELYGAPVSKVWNALTDKDQMKEWYFEIPDFELKEGAVFNFYEPGGKKQFHHRCAIKKVELHKLFQHTWSYPGKSKGESVLTWELFEQNGQTLVRLSHTGLDGFEDGGKALSKENFEAGWKEIMGGSLKDYLEAR